MRKTLRVGGDDLFCPRYFSVVLCAVAQLLNRVLAVLIAIVFAEFFYGFLNYKVRRIFFGIAHKALILKESVVIGYFFNVAIAAVVRRKRYGCAEYAADIVFVFAKF